MRKIIKVLICALLLTSVLYIADVWKDKQVLQDNLIRLHVVANSDLQKDQESKLKVKDTIVNYLQPLLADFSDKEQVMNFLEDNLSTIEEIANRVLVELGEDDRAIVSLAEETFDTRQYDTFALPAGVYDSLRVRIGEGQGRNWWCVVFPTLCMPATTDGFQDVAVSSGFSASLGDSLISGRNLRFYVLDCFGKIEKLFH